MASAAPLTSQDSAADQNRIAFDIVEAARAARLSRATIFAELNAGRLKARKYGRRTVILRDDLMAWLNSLPTRETRLAA